ncbi:MAG: hypothetical protein A2X61_10280 [Ignavibacteria bacterium GWB2_35_12]|nr:MAG: hypothetical protein A2X61_10280 [Ignavibacteria bacterium GWB2_35_12]OGV21358.1 MAG: hypothetical protein A2475_15000 [Ignavibacteria bacterium RIFOXYC2_FULL_35_21]
MSYESVDKLQKALVENVFHYAKDSKKAAGRALGTLVEIITYYLLKTWDFNNYISIEKGLKEYGNPEISHNVEYSLHPIIRSTDLLINKTEKSITASQILKELNNQNFSLSGLSRKTNNLLSKEGILRNACAIAESKNSFLLCSIKSQKGPNIELCVYEQNSKPFAVFECKRVGVEEGISKGPQTIEKAKQGAYVARTASSLQKIRTESGEMYGIIYKSDNTFYIKPYTEFMEEIIFSNNTELLRRFIMTIGVVSNHGNWFTSENQNKEMKVLAQSYDWLLFLSDKGLSEFIDKLIMNPKRIHLPIRDAFISSYSEKKVKNQFTKVQMNLDADRILLDYFSINKKKIESWFNVISPKKKHLSELKSELNELKNKNWKEILK